MRLQEDPGGSNIGISYRSMILCCQITIEKPSFLLIFSIMYRNTPGKHDTVHLRR